MNTIQPIRDKHPNQTIAIGASAAVASAVQSIATYPLTTMSIRNLSSTPKTGHLYGGLSIEFGSRILKSTANATILYRLYNLPLSENKVCQASISGALSGIGEAYLLNPLTVCKNICQTTQKKPSDVIPTLKLRDLYRGVNVTAARNGILSAVAIGTYAKLTLPENKKSMQSAVGGASFVLGGVCTTSLEAHRVSKVVGSKRQPYIKALHNSAPGLFKLLIMGAAIGPTLHKILYGPNFKASDQ